jgi:hypothetical protein
MWVMFGCVSVCVSVSQGFKIHGKLGLGNSVSLAQKKLLMTSFWNL